MLEIIGLGAGKETVIESLVPRKRNLPAWRYYYKAKDRSLAEELRNPLVWDSTLFDGDSSL
jgi:hypothetical protein